jgi:hypothetical protein
MSSGTIGFRFARRTIGALALGAALVCGLSPASASDARSSPEDRQRLVSIARGLEQAPLKPGARAERTWAVEWITNAPDVSVTICTEPLAGLVRSDYQYAPEITLQDMFSMAASAIEHPESSNDPVAQQLAGVEGALTAYRSILRDKPDSKSPILEGLLQTQSRGELPDFVRRAWAACSAKR